MPLIRKSATPGEVPQPASLQMGTSNDRWDAARAAGGQPDGVASLAAALATETDPRVREAIFTGLVRIGTTASVDAVVPYIQSEDASLRTGAIDALRVMKGASSGHLPRLLAHEDADVRILSCELARDLPAAEASRLLCDLLEGESEKNVCAAAVEVLAEIGNPAALPVLQRCATRFANDPFVVFSIKVAMERLGGASATSRE